MLELMYDLMMDDKMAQSSKVVREPDRLLMFLCTKLTSKILVSRHLGKQRTVQLCGNSDGWTRIFVSQSFN